MAKATTAGPNDRQAIGVELAKLIAAFPAQDPGMTAQLRIGAYSDALGDAPAWAVREARLKVVQGTATVLVKGEATALDKRYAPTPPQLAEIVRDVLQPFRNDLAELVLLEQVTAALPPDAAERGRVADGFRRLKDEIKPPVERWDAPARLRRQAEAGGIDYDAAMAGIPDAPERTGTFARPHAEAAE